MSRITKKYKRVHEDEIKNQGFATLQIRPSLKNVCNLTQQSGSMWGGWKHINKLHNDEIGL